MIHIMDNDRIPCAHSIMLDFCWALLTRGAKWRILRKFLSSENELYNGLGSRFSVSAMNSYNVLQTTQRPIMELTTLEKHELLYS